MNYSVHSNYQFKNSNDFNPDNDKLLHAYITASILFSFYWEGGVVQGEPTTELPRKKISELILLIFLSK